MVAQSAVNRLRSGRSKEFGGSMEDVLSKGYYAVKSPNVPYKQALSGVFSDAPSKKAWDETQSIVQDVLTKQDYGQAMFYFTPKEIEKLKSKKAFNFDVVKPTGTVGGYETFGYPEKKSHYRKD